MEIVETKKQLLRHDGINTKPQLAPRSARTLGRTGSESGSSIALNSGGGSDAANRMRRDADAYESLESGGYARITPRKSSVDSSNRIDPSTGRRSSVSSSSRRSSGDGSQLSVRLSSPGYSLPRTPLSPASKGVFDFNLDPASSCKGYREGPPDRLWINSLRSSSSSSSSIGPAAAAVAAVAAAAAAAAAGSPGSATPPAWRLATPSGADHVKVIINPARALNS